MKPRYLFLTLTLLAFILIHPNHASAEAEKTSVKISTDIVFPPPPDLPRIKYIKSIKTERDLSGIKKSLINRLWRALIGSSTSDAILLTRPYGVAVHKEKILVSDTESASIVVLNTQEQKIGRIGAGAMERLVSPIGVAIDSKGRTIVSDSVANTVKFFNPDGHLELQISKLGPDVGEFKKPTGLAIGLNDDVIVADTGNSRLIVLSSEGRFLRQIGRRGTADSEFSVPVSLWVEHDGTILVSDAILCRVQAFSYDGRFLFKFGEQGDMAGYLARPRGIASDSDGNIYVVDAIFNAIQMFNRQGQLLLFFGGHGGAPASFQLPAGIFINENDQIYIVDSFNRRIQIFQYIKHPPKSDG